MRNTLSVSATQNILSHTGLRRSFFIGLGLAVGIGTTFYAYSADDAAVSRIVTMVQSQCKADTACIAQVSTNLERSVDTLTQVIKQLKALPSAQSTSSTPTTPSTPTPATPGTAASVTVKPSITVSRTASSSSPSIQEEGAEYIVTWKVTGAVAKIGYECYIKNNKYASGIGLTPTEKVRGVFMLPGAHSCRWTAYDASNKSIAEAFEQFTVREKRVPTTTPSTTIGGAATSPAGTVTPPATTSSGIVQSDMGCYYRESGVLDPRDMTFPDGTPTKYLKHAGRMELISSQFGCRSVEFYCQNKTLSAQSSSPLPLSRTMLAKTGTREPIYVIYGVSGSSYLGRDPASCKRSQEYQKLFPGQ